MRLFLIAVTVTGLFAVPQAFAKHHHKTMAASHKHHKKQHHHHKAAIAPNHSQQHAG
jgi:hypothetical protein